MFVRLIHAVDVGLRESDGRMLIDDMGLAILMSSSMSRASIVHLIVTAEYILVLFD